MIRVEVIEQFNFKDYDKIKDTIKRKSIDMKGTLFIGDTFECDEDMIKYLTGDNPLSKTVVKVIEVEPIKENKEEPKIIEAIETSVGTFGYGPVEVKTTKPKTPKKKKSSKK